MARIVDVAARLVWDSRGRSTVEAEVALKGARGRAIAPAGASTGSGEAKCVETRQAVRSINGEIRACLLGKTLEQESIDRALIALDGTPDKSRLGANAIVAVSLAAAHAAAAASRKPLWEFLAGGRQVAMPVPQIQVFGGGAHARGSIDLQDFMIVCTGAGGFAESLEWTSQVYRAAGERLAARGALRGVADEGGWWPAFDTNEQALAELTGAIADAGFEPGADIGVALDVAATQLWRDGRYRLEREGKALTASQLHALLLQWIERYPIVSIEDPFAEHDSEAMASFTRTAGGRIQVVGDDFLVTSSGKLRAAKTMGACNAVLLKPNQAGTLTETLECWRAAQAAGYDAIVSARSGETEDVTIVHLALGWGVPQLKVGGFARSERMAKWNEGLRIEEALGGALLPYPASRLFGRGKTRGRSPDRLAP